MASQPMLSDLHTHVVARVPAYLADLETLVNIDCGSYTPEGVNRVADAVVEHLTALGAAVERIGAGAAPDGRPLGDLVIGRLAGSGPRLLLIGHMDTVFEPGTVAARPFRVEGGRALGPGVSDMKGGLLAGLTALAAAQAAGHRPSVTFVANPDEEIGSPFSGPVIGDLAAGHDAALVLECARANGDIVSARKGIAEMVVTVHGRAAHAGVEPEKGRSAILAASRLVESLHALNGRWPTVTCNVGVIAGGTRPNVVAESCRLEVDLRAANTDEFGEATAAAAEIMAATSVPDTTAEQQVIASHPPMEKSAASERLVELARSIGSELGFEVRDALTGGASDANTTAAAGLPTLDGLGPIGGDDHALPEWLDLASVAPRTTLLAGLVLRAQEAL
ncbi:MAG TPA: M20 family metallopeptidase [Candidatus Limnocylindria bacterium]|nr:M20 family metallopeptidase [Candidatus Limnocylindria bacterium]